MKKIPFRKILWATDFSPHAEEAFQWAREICRKTSAELLVRHVIGAGGDLKFLPSVDEEMIKRAEAERDAELTERLLQYVKMVREDGLRSNAKILKGKPWQAIVEEARREKARLIVMGVKGTGALENIFVGSTLTRVVHHSPYPVLCIPLNAGKPRFERILVPTDLTSASKKALKLALKISPFTSSKITLLHIIEMGKTHIPPETAEKIEKKTINRLERMAGKEMNVENDIRFLEKGDIAREIIDFAETTDQSLIFITTHTRKRFFRVIWGSVTEKIIRYTFVPVCVTRG